MKKSSKSIYFYYAFLALTALGLGLSFETLSNYLKDAFAVNALERGLIEFPREIPGAIVFLVISYLAFLGDIRIAIIGEILCVLSILLLGFLSPGFAVMILLLFVFSLGMHLLLPLLDSIGLSLVEDEKTMGSKLGFFKGIYTSFSMVAMGMLFIGFKTGFFSYTARVIKPFILCALFMSLAVVILSLMKSRIRNPISTDRKVKWVFRKEYKYFYVLTIMTGIQKQIMFVFGPWVLIEMLNKKTDVISVLFFFGTFIGIFFIPYLGRLIDRFGVKKLLYADAISFVFVYASYGFLTSGFRNGVLAAIGVPVFLAYLLIILDKMSMQMSIIRTIYLKNILVEESDLTKTLTMGLSLDHCVTIMFAVLGGFIWTRFGAEYIFYGVSLLSFVNVFVAWKVKPESLKVH